MLALAASSAPARAEDYTDRWGLGLDAGWAEPLGSDAVRSTAGHGPAVGASFTRGLTPNWRAALSYENIDLRGMRFEPVTASGIYAFFPEYRLTPFFALGLGGARATRVPDQGNQNSFVAKLSAGLEYSLLSAVSASASATLYSAGHSSTASGHEVDAAALSLGLTYWFPGGDHQAAYEQPEAAPEVFAPPPPAPAPAPAVAPSPPPSPHAPVAAPPAPAETVSIALNVRFEKSKDVVRPEYDAGIGAVAVFLRAHPSAAAEIEGHTDNVGSSAYNTALSQRRAESVRRALIEKFGIEASRLTAKGYGPDKPIADNDTPEGRARNRRVVATIEAEK